jgi:hypothetical protein
MPVTVRFGEQLDPERYADRQHDRMALRELTDEVMYEIGQLSGYEYVDTYATKKAENLPTDVARVPPANGHGNGYDDGSQPRRSSADVLNPQGAVPAAH